MVDAPNRASVEAVEAPGTLPAARGSVVAIGNFDGVHRGHRQVLDRALAIAREREISATVLTFEPHPRELFSGERVFRLTPQGEKAKLLHLLGFDHVVSRTFDREFASLSAEAFMQEVLVEGLGVGHVVVGHDFRFGAKRAGDAAMLEASSLFEASIIEPYSEEGAIVSSSRVREALSDGRPDVAAGLLGRRWRVSATVRHGRKVGRTIGYPTANMVLDPAVDLAHGIYAVRYRRENGDLHDGVASFGRRPTFDDGAPLLETFLFDFDGDLYGERGSVSLFQRLRGEEKFDGVEALVEQMDRDSAAARGVLADAEPIGRLDRLVSFEPEAPWDR